VAHLNAHQSLNYYTSVHFQLHSITVQRPPAVPVSTQANSRSYRTSEPMRALWGHMKSPHERILSPLQQTLNIHIEPFPETCAFKQITFPR